jgi:hypothetical protein
MSIQYCSLWGNIFYQVTKEEEIAGPDRRRFGGLCLPK